MSCRLLCAASLTALAAAGHCWTFSDDFESYALGTFPSANWNDAGLITPIGTIPNPSSLIERKTTEAGTQTHALNFGDYFGLCSGIYRSEPVVPVYNLTVDVRIDRWSTATPSNTVIDWPVAVGFNKFDAAVNPGIWSSIQVYGSTLTKDWRLYGANPSFAWDIPLGGVPDVGIWDRVTMSFDDSTGAYSARIVNLRTGVVTVNASGVLPGWTTVGLDTLAMFNGQQNFGDSNAISGLANVDNIMASGVPEPASLAVVAVGLVGVLRRRRPR